MKFAVVKNPSIDAYNGATGYQTAIDGSFFWRDFVLEDNASVGEGSLCLLDDCISSSVEY